jgi:hypothetical protein
LIYAITILTAAAAGAARLHVVFVERLEGARAASRVAKVAGFVRYADWTFSALLAASALLMIPSHRLIAATIGASAVVFAYALLVIEPGTTRKGIPRRASGVRRKRPV